MSGGFPLKYLVCAVAALGIIRFCINLERISSSIDGVVKVNHAAVKTVPDFGRIPPQSIADGIPELEAEENYLAFCVLAKDQTTYLPEFLKHHYYHMNVSHFYIMDDHSDPPMDPDYDYGIPRSALTFKYYNKNEASYHPNGMMQFYLDDQCMKMYGYKHTWLAFIDADEFLEVKTNETFKGILRELEKDDKVGALGVNWLTHTSNGLLTRPESMRDSFTECINDDNNIRKARFGPADKHVKSFVLTKYYHSVWTPHQMWLKENRVTVGEDGKQIAPGQGQRIPIRRERLALHHYAIKSKAEFEEKMNRWKGDIPRTWDYWDEIEKVPHVNCTEMAHRYNP